MGIIPKAPIPEAPADTFLLLDPPPGAPPLRLRSFAGVEGLSQLFHFDLELNSPDAPLDGDETAAALLGKGIGFGVRRADGGPRWFHGVVGRVTQTADAHTIRAEVFPWLWLFSRRADCRVFADKRLDEILTELFAGVDGADFDLSGVAAYPRYEASVMYRETALNYVLRLLEHEGVAFFFRWERGRHTLVLTDAPGVGEAPLAVPLRPPNGAEAFQESDAVHSWRRRRELRPERYTLGAWHWPTRTHLVESQKTAADEAPAFGEIYDVGVHADADEGKRHVRLRMQEEEARRRTAAGTGAVRAFAAGACFRLAAPPEAPALEISESAGAYLLTSVEHHAREGGDDGDTEYHNAFACLPLSPGVVFRPARQTPKPVIQGVQTALVVGPDGKDEPGDGPDVHTDGAGRVRVRFPWDRRGGAEGAVWARMAQPWAGRGFGAWFPPRVGQEVVATFDEGDPDRPMVVGCVYSEARELPFDPAGEPARAGVRSRSSPNGAAGRGNEVSFDDGDGKEELRLGAQRDLEIHVRHDEHALVEGARLEKVGGDQDLTVGGDVREQVGGAYGLAVGGDVTIKAGGKLVLEAGSQISIVVGGNYIDVGPSGVSINGTAVRLNCAGGAPAQAAEVKARTPPPPRKRR